MNLNLAPTTYGCVSTEGREASRVLKFDYAKFSRPYGQYIKNKETYPYKRRYLVTVLEMNSNNKKKK